jgi:membrane protein implicated in regulation of membrane protease activity
MVLKRSDFFRYGFFILLIAAAFNLFMVFLKPGSLSYSLLHFYAIATAVYFVSRDIRLEAGSKRKHHKTRDKNH